MNYSPEIDTYIAEMTPEIQSQLQELRQLIHTIAPEVTEKMSYQMPTFYLNGNMIHFAAFKKHIGLYPGPSGVVCVQAELVERGYKWAKGSIQFPLNQPLPWELIRTIIEFRYQEQVMKQK